MSDSKPIVCVGTSNGVVVLRHAQEGEPWELISHGLYGHKVASLGQHADGSIFVGLVDGMVQCSKDWETWQPRFEGLTSTSVYSLAHSPADPNTVFAGTAPAGVFVSSDSGLHWSKLANFNKVKSSDNWTYPEAPYMPRVNSLFFHPSNADVLFASVEVGGVVASLDRGQTWVDRGAGLPRQVKKLVCPRGAAGRLYASTILGFYRSDDLGESWQNHVNGLPWLDAHALCVDPDNSDHVLLGVNKPNHQGGTVFSSKNGGLNWELASASLPAAAQAPIASMAAGDKLFYAGTAAGHLYYSANATQWALVRPPFQELHCILPLRPL